VPRYKDHNQLQNEIIVIDYQDQLTPGTFEYAINHIVNHELDLSGFDNRFNNDLTGAPGYDPRGMIKIVLYAYSLGIIHTRKIQKACETNTIFMALSGNMRPDHSTIANFVSGMGERANTLFTDVLLLCDKLGLIGKNMFAIDGCKISSNASKEWSGKIEDFERRKKKMEEEVKKLLQKHKELDDQNEDLKEQIEREKKAIENYKKKIKKMAEFIKGNEDRISSSGNIVQSNITDPESAKLKSSTGEVKQGYNAIATVDDLHQVIVDAQAIGSINERDSVVPMLENVREIFGEENLRNTKITADAGFSSEEILEYLEKEGVDAYIPDKHFRERDERFTGRDVYKERFKKKEGTWKTKYFGIQDFQYDAENDRLICPAGEWLYKSGKPIQVRNFKGQRYKGRETKCPFCALRPKCMKGTKKTIRQVCVNLSKYQEEDKKSFIQKMKEKIDSVKGRFIYSLRLGVVEPVFAHICHLLRLKYFTLKGKLKVNSQWKLYATVHNMKKLFGFSPLFA
jgi:transposase